MFDTDIDIIGRNSRIVHNEIVSLKAIFHQCISIIFYNKKHAPRDRYSLVNQVQTLLW